MWELNYMSEIYFLLPPIILGLVVTAILWWFSDQSKRPIYFFWILWAIFYGIWFLLGSVSAGIREPCSDCPNQVIYLRHRFEEIFLFFLFLSLFSFSSVLELVKHLISKRQSTKLLLVLALIFFVSVSVVIALAKVPCDLHSGQCQKADTKLNGRIYVPAIPNNSTK